MPQEKKPAPLEFEKPLAELESMLENVKVHSKEHGMDVEEEMKNLRERIAEMRAKIYSNLTPWQRVLIARHQMRPYALDLLKLIATDFTELHGDRSFFNDKAIIGGFATIAGRKVLVVGQQKGRDTKERIMRNFGQPHPEGYRKALRLMRLADRFRLPIVVLIDTPGAYAGLQSEERHVAEAIAVNLREMFGLRVPIVGVIIGEGGSGGALGIGITNRVLILENAYYSVISPEGCAAILWKDAKQAEKAAAALKMTAPDLKEFGLVDEIVPEPTGGAHHDWEAAAKNVSEAIVRHLAELEGLSEKQLLNDRYDKFRAYGRVAELQEELAAPAQESAA